MSIICVYKYSKSTQYGFNYNFLLCIKLLYISTKAIGLIAQGIITVILMEYLKSHIIAIHESCDQGLSKFDLLECMSSLIALYSHIKVAVVLSVQQGKKCFLPGETCLNS